MERTVLYKDALCEMAVDKSTYLGYMDYELDIEYSRKHTVFVPSLLEQVAS